MANETIEDVARLADVSIGTVSRVLNGTKRVSPQTRARVLAAIDQLQYSRNAAAHRLRSRSTKSAALIMSHLANPTFGPIITGIEETLSDHGYTLMLCDSNQSAQREAQHVGTVAQERIAGLIIIPSTLSGAVLEPLFRRHVPIVCLDRRLHDVSIDTVILDNRRAARMATEHLLNLGHRRIGLITSMMSTPGIERREGFVHALEAAGVPLDERLIREGSYTADRAYQAATAMLSESPPSALVVANFPMVLGAMQALHEHGLTVPDDVSLVGVDDAPWLPYMRPPLTVVSQPYKVLGQTAACMLLDRITGDKSGVPAREVMLDPFMVIRGSTAPVGMARAGSTKISSTH